jgi:hypothetical protein
MKHVIWHVSRGRTSRPCASLARRNACTLPRRRSRRALAGDGRCATRARRRRRERASRRRLPPRRSSSPSRPWRRSLLCRGHRGIRAGSTGRAGDVGPARAAGDARPAPAEVRARRPCEQLGDVASPAGLTSVSAPQGKRRFSRRARDNGPDPRLLGDVAGLDAAHLGPGQSGPAARATARQVRRHLVGIGVWASACPRRPCCLRSCAPRPGAAPRCSPLAGSDSPRPGGAIEELGGLRRGAVAARPRAPRTWRSARPAELRRG